MNWSRGESFDKKKERECCIFFASLLAVNGIFEKASKIQHKILNVISEKMIPHPFATGKLVNFLSMVFRMICND